MWNRFETGSVSSGYLSGDAQDLDEMNEESDDRNDKRGILRGSEGFHVFLFKSLVHYLFLI